MRAKIEYHKTAHLEEKKLKESKNNSVERKKDYLRRKEEITRAKEKGKEGKQVKG